MPEYWRYNREGNDSTRKKYVKNEKQNFLVQVIILEKVRLENWSDMFESRWFNCTGMIESIGGYSTYENKWKMSNKISFSIFTKTEFEYI